MEEVEKVCLASLRDRYGIAAKDAKTKKKKTKDPEKAALAKALARWRLDLGPMMRRQWVRMRS